LPAARSSGAVNCKLSAVSSAEGGARLFLDFLQALGAIAADFCARDRNLHMEIAGNLFFQLFVQPALKLPHFPASQARPVFLGINYTHSMAPSVME